jgi:hypothetical protein
MSLLPLARFPAAEEPRAIIGRAVKAQGGAEVLGLQSATWVKLRGKLGLVKGDDGVPVEAEFWNQPDDTKTKWIFRVTLGETKAEIQQLFTGAEGWQSLGGPWEKLSPDDVEAARVSARVDRVMSLLPLLKERGYTLAPLPGSNVQGRPAVGVKVSAKDMPDVQLHFDKETGLLVTARYTTHDKDQKKDVQTEVVLGDYREVNFAAADEAVLRKAGLKVSDEALLGLLQKQTPGPEALKRARALVRQLADDDFEKREKAGEELVSLGAAAVPALRGASKDDDPEVARRAADCLKKIEGQTDPEVIKAVLRLTGLRHPPGAAPVLLAYLTGSEGELRREAQAALWALAQHKGPPDPDLVKALKDSDPIRRAAAAAALGEDGGAFARQPGRRLFPKGIKQPMKYTLRNDTETKLDAEVIEMQMFNRFEDKVFARPR